MLYHTNLLAVRPGVCVCTSYTQGHCSHQHSGEGKDRKGRVSASPRGFVNRQ